MHGERLSLRVLFGRKQKGFTLVELLVVAGIIGLLAALIMAGVARAKAQAQRTVCLNHLSQIGKAMWLATNQWAVAN